MFRYIHSQLSGYVSSSKDWKAAQHTTDRGASKAIAVLLVAIGITLSVAPIFLSCVTPRIALRSLATSVLLFASASRYWKGISIKWVLARFFRYWMPNAMLIYIYVVVGSIAIEFFKGEELLNVGKQSGIMMMTLAFLAGTASWMHARILIEDRQEGDPSSLDAGSKAKVFAFRLYALVWVAFFVGGGVMLAEATWFGDWLIVDILGW